MVVVSILIVPFVSVALAAYINKSIFLAAQDPQPLPRQILRLPFDFAQGVAQDTLGGGRFRWMTDITENAPFSKGAQSNGWFLSV